MRPARASNCVSARCGTRSTVNETRHSAPTAVALPGGKMLPKKVIGTVNASEFFINLASATTFVFLVKITDWEALAGLIIGGFLIAPYAAKATSKMSIKMILTVVGCLIIIISLRKIIPLFL